MEGKEAQNRGGKLESEIENLSPKLGEVASDFDSRFWGDRHHCQNSLPRQQGSASDKYKWRHRI